jgi:hypothetical protein
MFAEKWGLSADFRKPQVLDEDCGAGRKSVTVPDFSRTMCLGQRP